MEAGAQGRGSAQLSPKTRRHSLRAPQSTLNLGESTLSCDNSNQLQGVPAPPDPKCQKTSQKGRLRPTGPECQKSAKKCRKSRKSHEKVPKRDYLGIFLTFLAIFLALRADRPGQTFLRLSRHFGPRGPGTPSNWWLQSQTSSDFPSKNFLDWRRRWMANLGHFRCRHHHHRRRRHHHHHHSWTAVIVL